DVPAALARVIDKMLAKRVTDRYQTPGEVADALAGLRADWTITTGAAPTEKVAAVASGTRLAASAPTLRRAGGATPGWLWGMAGRWPRLSLGMGCALFLGLAMVLLGSKPWGGILESDEKAAIQGVLQLLDRPEIEEAEVLQRLTRLIRKNPGILPTLR